MGSLGAEGKGSPGPHATYPFLLLGPSFLPPHSEINNDADSVPREITQHQGDIQITQ